MTEVQNIKTPYTRAPAFTGIQTMGTLKLVGLRRAIDGLPSKVVPEFWENFSPYRGWIPGQVGRDSYGVLMHRAEEEGFDYLTAVKVFDFEKIGPDWDRFEAPGERYAIFQHGDHVSKLRAALHTIFAHSLPELNLNPRKRASNRPILVERYANNFDLKTGWGFIEVWVPLAY